MKILKIALVLLLIPVYAWSADSLMLETVRGKKIDIMGHDSVGVYVFYNGNGCMSCLQKLHKCRLEIQKSDSSVRFYSVLRTKGIISKKKSILALKSLMVMDEYYFDIFEDGDDLVRGRYTTGLYSRFDIYFTPIILLTYKGKYKLINDKDTYSSYINVMSILQREIKQIKEG